MKEAPSNSIHPTTVDEWRAWLAANHDRPTGVWLVSYKRQTGRARIEYADAVEEALCYGWIDSKAATLDAERSMQWFSPRRPGSGWSASNKQRVERLVAAGRMTPAGAAKIAAAKADGSWTRLDAVDALELPRDLETALKRHRPAATHFQAFPPSVKRLILAWIADAKRPDTRQRRVEETARLAAQNVRARGALPPSG